MTSPRISAAIDLPWPSRVLHPNERPHWARKAKAAKSARLAASMMAKSIGRIEADALKAVCIFSPPDNRARDLDGMLTNIKAYLDGIADVVGIDDSKWQIELCRGVPRKGGNVRIVLAPADDAWESLGDVLNRVLREIDPSKDAA